MSKKTIGDQELALLQYIEEAPKSSVAEVCAGYGEARGLARSTVLTMPRTSTGTPPARNASAVRSASSVAKPVCDACTTRMPPGATASLRMPRRAQAAVKAAQASTRPPASAKRVSSAAITA